MSLQTLEIARSALYATRVGLEVASQNVANASTPGYVRQRVLLAPIPNADTSGGGLVGGGVDVLGIERLRDRCLEAQINHEEGRLGQEQARSASLARVQTAFPDLAGSGLSLALGDLFDSLQRLQTMAGSITARQEVIFSAQSLSDQLHATTAKLTEETQILEQDLQMRVGRVNELVGTVAQLNGKIMSLGDNPQANDLQVLREEAIRELATLCGATGLDQPDGSQDVILGGVRLVQGMHSVRMSLVPDPDDPTRSQVAVGDVTPLDTLSGLIAGDLLARDSNLAQWQQALDDLTTTLADAFNARHRAGYDLNGHPGGDFFTYDPANPAATLTVSAAIADDPGLFAAATEITGPPGDGGNAAALFAVRSAQLFGGTETIEQFHASLIYDVGVQTERAQDAAAARQTLLTSLDEQYTNQAGVSLDEEAIDIMRLQQSYSAATKLIQVADQMVAQVLELVE